MPESLRTDDLVLGVDLGGTKILTGLVDRAGVRHGPTVGAPTPAQDGPEEVLDAVARAAARALESASGPVRGVGVGSAGVIDPGDGVVVGSTDAFRDWPGTEIATGISRRLGGFPVVVDNDVNAHATGESWLGAGRGATIMLLVTVGTGVGAAIALEGRVVSGRHHMTGELGHTPARGAEHLRCGCGHRGHLEAIASGPGLVRHYRSLGGTRLPDARAVVRAADSGDPTAVRAVTDAASVLGTTLAGVVTTLDPDVVVLGGGLSNAGTLWWDAVENSLRAELVEPLTDVPLRRPELGPDAALIGAARLAWNRLTPDVLPDATDTGHVPEGDVR